MRRAERLVRRLVSHGRVEQSLYEAAWHVTRDWAYRSGHWPWRLHRAVGLSEFTREVDDRAALYPETVRLLEVVASAHFIELIKMGRTGTDSRRDFLHRSLEWLPGEHWMVAEAVERWVSNQQITSAARAPSEVTTRG